MCWLTFKSCCLPLKTIAAKNINLLNLKKVQHYYSISTGIKEKTALKYFHPFSREKKTSKNNVNECKE